MDFLKIKNAKINLITVLTLVVISIFLSGVVLAQNQNAESVYLIKSHDSELKAKFGVRHNFDVGFTTKLNVRGVEGLQKQGIEVEAVPLYQPLAPPGACSPWPECKNGDDGSSDRLTPSDQTPWGIEKVYNDSSIASTSGGLGVDVAVLDTGVNKNHLDLKNRIEQCVDFTGKGRNSISEGKCDDRSGHGTHVSGTIAADAGSDGLGIYGVAPEADIFAYKVCGNDGCWTDDIAAAIDYAGSHGAEIISMSLGGSSESSLIRDAISRNLHILFVAAAGNSGPNLETMNYPGASPNVMGVAAIDINNNVADFSSRGFNDTAFKYEHKYMEVAAPGVSVESTWNDGGYNTISGTSMATPHVSGLAAKYWSSGEADANNDGTTPEEVRVYIQQRASLTDITSGQHARIGYDPASGFGLPTVV